MIDTYLQSGTKSVLKSLVKFLIKIKLTANHITILGLLLGITSALFVYLNNTILALVLLYLSGLCDILDGNMAREKGMSSPLGTLMDISFDRIVEVSIILAIAFRTPESMPIMLLLLASIVISISIFLTVGILVSKDSNKSFFYATGIMERTESFILFSLLIIFPKYILIIGLIGVLLILITGLQRFLWALKQFN